MRPAIFRSRTIQTPDCATYTAPRMPCGSAAYAMAEFQGWRALPNVAHTPDMIRFVERATPRERELIGRLCRHLAVLPRTREEPVHVHELTEIDGRDALAARHRGRYWLVDGRLPLRLARSSTSAPDASRIGGAARVARAGLETRADAHCWSITDDARCASGLKIAWHKRKRAATNRH